MKLIPHPPLTQSLLQPEPWRLAPPAWVCRHPMMELAMLSEGFERISLAEMEDVALLNRVDTKFLLTSEQLVDALAELQADYWMLEVNQVRLNHYCTLYFDTPRFDLYHDHVHDRPERYKVRCREYADSHLAFLEVKHHTRKDRTIKDRIRLEQPAVSLEPEWVSWLRQVCPLESAALEPKLWNTFTRITLVSKECCERVTLDTELTFSTDDRHVKLEGIAVAEVKMEKNHQSSPFIAQMRRQRIRPQGFSKYAFGVALLAQGVKRNALKPKLLQVEKMMKGPGSHV